MPSPREYTIGWICPLSIEYVAARMCLDEEHDIPDQVATRDNNVYTLGRIGKHNIVIATLPDGEYGTSVAASVARDMVHSFPKLRIGLLVGIGGAGPSSNNDIRLGDVVVSAPRDGQGGVVQYDFGRVMQTGEFQNTGFLDQPPMVLRSAVTSLRGRHETDGHGLQTTLNGILDRRPQLRRKYQRPSPETDRLYRSEVVHPPEANVSCTESCGNREDKIVSRLPRPADADDPTIHYGLIASGNKLMKNAVIRDRITSRTNALCFEMEAAGLMNHFPCLVIRGICDYSDSHKNDEWQGYAAMMAAAYAKELLARIPPTKVEAQITIEVVLSHAGSSSSSTTIHSNTSESTEREAQPTPQPPAPAPASHTSPPPPTPPAVYQEPGFWDGFGDWLWDLLMPGTGSDSRPGHYRRARRRPRR